MGIVLGNVSSAPTGRPTAPKHEQVPPVEGAVRLTAMEMNMLHFGSGKNSPLPQADVHPTE